MMKFSLFTLGGFSGLLFGIYLRDSGYTSTVVRSYYKFSDSKRNNPINIDEEKLQLQFNKMIDDEKIKIRTKEEPKVTENLKNRSQKTDVFFDYSTTKINKTNY